MRTYEDSRLRRPRGFRAWFLESKDSVHCLMGPGLSNITNNKTKPDPLPQKIMTTPEQPQPDYEEPTGRIAPVSASFLDSLIEETAAYFPGDDLIIED